MPKKSNTLPRQWALLRSVPSSPIFLSTPELHQKLQDHGFEVDIRSVQRDLVELSLQFPLTSETRGRKQFWQWMPGAKGLEIPGMSSTTALVLHMAGQYLRTLMPANLLSVLGPYFDRALEVLNRSEFAHWDEKVMQIERGPRLTPPEVLEQVRDVVFQSLLDGTRFEADYVKRYDSKPEHYLVNPLGLVTREGISYLICTLWDYPNAIQLAMHRFVKVTSSSQAVKAPEGFKLSKYVKSEDAFAYPKSSRSIRLRAVFDEGAGFHLTERKLSQDQRIRKLSASGYELKATVSDTADLRWWLLGFGDGVEILGPKSLRDEFKDMSHNMAKMYQ